MIVPKATLNVRKPNGRFPPGSVADVLRQVRPLVMRDVAGAFEKHRDPATGRPWPSRKHPYPWPTLVKSGDLKAGATKAAGAATVTGNTLTVRVVDPHYARFQNRRFRFTGVSLATLMAVRRLLRAAGKAALLTAFRGRRA